MDPHFTFMLTPWERFLLIFMVQRKEINWEKGMMYLSSCCQKTAGLGFQNANIWLSPALSREQWKVKQPLWKILKEMGIPDHLTCLLRNLYAGQEGTVRMIHETMDWFQIGKRVRQVCILSPCLFNFYAEYIMWNAALDEAQAGIKTASWNSNNLRYGDNTTLMAESEKELKSLLM